MANNNNMRPNNAVSNNARPNAARPNAARPNTANPYQQNPYQQNPYQQNPYQQNPYQQNPYQQNPYQQNPYQQNPYQQNPYQQNPYQQNPYRQNPYQQNPYNQNAYMANASSANYDPKKPNYVMKKSAWSVIKWWHILFGFLIIPLLIMLWKIINIKDETISFYSNKVVQRHGILAKHEKTTVLTRMLSVTIHQTFWGRIFNYGDIIVDVVGKWDIDTKGIRNPKKAKEFLEKIAMDGMRMRPIIMN